MADWERVSEEDIQELIQEIPDNLHDGDSIIIKGRLEGDSAFVELLDEDKGHSEDSALIPLRVELRANGTVEVTTWDGRSAKSKGGNVTSLGRDSEFTLNIQANKSGYEVLVNNIRVCDISHVVPLERVSDVSMFGEGAFTAIEFSDTVPGSQEGSNQPAYQTWTPPPVLNTPRLLDDNSDANSDYHPPPVRPIQRVDSRTSSIRSRGGRFTPIRVSSRRRPRDLSFRQKHGAGVAVAPIPIPELSENQQSNINVGGRPYDPAPKNVSVAPRLPPIHQTPSPVAITSSPLPIPPPSMHQTPYQPQMQVGGPVLQPEQIHSAPIQQAKPRSSRLSECCNEKCSLM